MSKILVEGASHWLLRTTIEGSVLIGMVLLVMALLGRNLGPRWRIALWILVGTKLLVPASISLVPGFGSAINIGTVAQVATEPVRSDRPMVEPVTVSEVGESILAEGSASHDSPLSFWLLGIWATGAAGFLAILFLRQYLFFRKTGNELCEDPSLGSLVAELRETCGLRREVKVVLGAPGSTPAVCGVFRPRLLLPSDWRLRFGESELRHIVIHELEHVRFGDLLWNWCAAFIHAPHWFNPLVWVAASRFQADRELRCDADTLVRLDPGERIPYGRTLLTVQENFHAAPAVAGLAPCVRNRPALHQRIAMITKPTASRCWLNITFSLALLGLIGLSFGAATADDEERGRAREGARNGERRGAEGEREGDRPREGEREGDRPREGEREGDRPREGEREGDRVRRGARDGEGEGRVRDGELKISVLRDEIVIGDRKITLINLRGALENRTESSAVLYAGSGVPTQNIKTVINALSDSGIKEVRLASSERAVMRRDGEAPREGARDGERRGPRDGEGGREGARDGEVRREGARDGEVRREGPRDGESRREGPLDGETRREGDREGEARRGESREGGEEMDARKFNQLSRIFKVYDKDNSKGVTFEEWVAMKNYELTDDQEKREKGWFDQADANSDAKITFGEWIDWKSNQGR